MVIAKDIVKKYGKKKVLDSVSLQAKPGQIVCIVGNNGCGKTTLLKIIAGIMKPDEGELLFYGNNALSAKGIFKKYIGFVPQDNPLFDDLSVADNISFWNSVADKPDDSLIKKYNLLDIYKEKVRTLSGGMKRRLSIVCTLLRKTPVLILDEPTSSLDLYYQRLIWDDLVDFKKRNGIVILSTHNRFEIENSDVCYLFAGEEILRYNKQDIDIDSICDKISLDK